VTENQHPRELAAEERAEPITITITITITQLGCYAQRQAAQ
jgi:hypothetical protein